MCLLFLLEYSIVTMENIFAYWVHFLFPPACLRFWQLINLAVFVLILYSFGNIIGNNNAGRKRGRGTVREKEKAVEKRQSRGESD